jgi:hypothetical protein
MCSIQDGVCEGCDFGFSARGTALLYHEDQVMAQSQRLGRCVDEFSQRLTPAVVFSKGGFPHYLCQVRGADNNSVYFALRATPKHC